MNRLVVIAIGGSGERVMASFLMELTAGMQVNATSVLPIFIDNDIESHSLANCKNLIEYYRKQATATDKQTGVNSIYEGLGTDQQMWPSFFRTTIEEPVYLDSDGKNFKCLNNVIGNLADDQLNISEERDLLFTDDDLRMPLDGGFVGNPNIGSVVLNAIALHDSRFLDKYESIGNKDGLVIIGSLFGGTGAAGIPLIVNKFRAKGDDSPRIGVVSMLPYFSTTRAKDEKTMPYDVIAEMFDVKTRAALLYYDEFMQHVDVQYYVGDKDCKAMFPHHIKGKKQANSAHPIEVMAALCVVDFSKGDFRNKIVFKRPTWNFTDDDTILSNLSDAPNADFRRAIAKFQMMKWLFTENELLKDDVKEDRAYVHNLGVTREMLDAAYNPDEQRLRQFPMMWGLNMMFHEWDRWLKELSNPNNEVPKKRKMVLVRDGKVDEKNLTKNFYTNHEHGWGLANVKLVRKIIGSDYFVPVPSNIKNELMDAYNRLVKQEVLPNPNKIADDNKKLPYLLRVISDALDSVIDKNCSI